MKEHHHIERLDDHHKRTHGWYVRFQVQKHPYRKMFSDTTYGGKRRSLSAAIQWRDQHLGAKLPQE